MMMMIRMRLTMMMVMIVATTGIPPQMFRATSNQGAGGSPSCRPSKEEQRTITWILVSFGDFHVLCQVTHPAVVIWPSRWESRLEPNWREEPPSPRQARPRVTIAEICEHLGSGYLEDFQIQDTSWTICSPLSRKWSTLSPLSTLSSTTIFFLLLLPLPLVQLLLLLKCNSSKNILRSGRFSFLLPRILCPCNASSQQFRRK